MEARIEQTWLVAALRNTQFYLKSDREIISNAMTGVEDTSTEYELANNRIYCEACVVIANLDEIIERIDKTLNNK